MVYTANGVVSYGFPMDDVTFTYLLSGIQPGTPSINVSAGDAAAAAVEGLAVTFDNSAANTMKVAGDGDPIHGRIRTAENRAVLGIYTAAVARQFKELLPTDATNSTGIGIGDSVVGAANGVVKKAGTPNNTRVVEVLPGYVAVELF